MPNKTYFVTFVYYDTKHQRSNKFSHLSIALLEGEKNTDGHFDQLKLCDSYGYYSHKMPNSGSASLTDQFLKKLFNINFRLQKYYAEFKREDLISLDMGFGLDGGPIIEITEEEKSRLEQAFQEIKSREDDFFKAADIKTKNEVDNLQISDQRKKKALALDYHHLNRERFYTEEVKNIDSYISENDIETDLLIEETAMASGLISPYQFQQEKLREVKGIDFFNFTFNPQGRTCKTMGLDLVINNLQNDESGNSRKFYLSSLFADQYYAYSLPVARKESAKIIFHSQQNQYQHSPGNPSLPERQWQTVNDCVLAVFENNAYIDLNGTKKNIYAIENIKLYTHLLENLIFLQRLLNDFCMDENLYQTELKIIDAGIRNVIAAKQNIKDATACYHNTLKQLVVYNCFTSIREEIFKSTQPFALMNYPKQLAEKHIKLEDGLRAELFRLAEIVEHARADDLEHLITPKQSLLTYFSFYKTRENSNTQTEAPSERPKLQ